MKTNDIIGSLSYIINISLTNTSEELIGSSNLWLPLLKQGRLNSVDHIIKKWKKSTSISLKFSWASDCKTTTPTILISFSQTCAIKVMISTKSTSSLPCNSKTFLRHLFNHKNKTKVNPELQKPNYSNSKSHQLPFLQAYLISHRWHMKSINKQNKRYLEICRIKMTTSTISLMTHMRGT